MRTILASFVCRSRGWMHDSRKQRVALRAARILECSRARPMRAVHRKCLQNGVCRLFDRRAHLRALSAAAVLEQIDKRQRHLAFVQIIAGIHSHRLHIARIVKPIIHQLERGADAPAEFGGGVFQRGVRIRNEGAELRRRFEQLGRFVVDDLHVACFILLCLSRVQQLQDFSFGNRVGRVSQNVHHAREYRKSPVNTLAALPKSALAVFLPRLRLDASTTSSCSSVAVWINSMTAARRWRSWRCAPSAALTSSNNAGLSRLPPAAIRYWAMVRISSTSESRCCQITRLS